ncbi:MAG: hypothetical protein G01um101430_470 [Parcubacteria group bacterium Gr01-1014_30]|nr:MAG: hypothetical protein G01um101430_470 [Parcubacteria group bacterium Gr01-1014_30]
MKSKIGLALVILYAIFVAFMLWQETTCESWGCGYSIGITTLPWPFIFGGNSSLLDVGLYIILNFLIFYFIGLGITKLLALIKSKT